MFRHHLTHMAGVQFNEQNTYAGVDEVVEEWPAAGFVDTEIRVFQEALSDKIGTDALRYAFGAQEFPVRIRP
jgi:hypothetical protein